MKRFSLLLSVIAFVAFLAASVHASPVDAQKAYNEGVGMMKKHEFTKAIGMFDTAIKGNPGFVKAYVGKGLCNLMMEKHEAAIEVLTKALRLDPGNVTGLWARGQANLILGNSKESIIDFSALLKKQPENARGYIGRAICEYRLGEANAATNDASRAIANNPKSADAFALRAISQFKEKKYDRSLDDTAKAVSLQPKDPYFQLLNYTALALNGKPNTDELTTFYGTADQKTLATHLIGMMLGKETPDAALKFAGDFQPTRLRPTMIQLAQTFIGLHYTISKDDAKAKQYMALAAKGPSKTPLVQGLVKKEYYEVK